MGKKGQKGKKGFTKGSKSNHSYHNLDRRSYLAKNKSAATAAVVSTASPINASHDRAANCHPPIVDGSDSDRSDSDTDDDYDENKPTISDSLRRHAIYYHYVQVFECPDRDEWYGPDGTIIRILLALKMLPQQHQTVKRCLIAIRKAWYDGFDYDPDSGNSFQGRPFKIQVGSFEAECIADLIEHRQMSIKSVKFEINKNRLSRHLAEGNDEASFLPYSDAAIYSCIKRMRPLTKAFIDRKQGSTCSSQRCGCTSYKQRFICDVSALLRTLLITW